MHQNSARHLASSDTPATSRVLVAYFNRGESSCHLPTVNVLLSPRRNAHKHSLWWAFQLYNFNLSWRHVSTGRRVCSKVKSFPIKMIDRLHVHRYIFVVGIEKFMLAWRSNQHLRNKSQLRSILHKTAMSTGHRPTVLINIKSLDFGRLQPSLHDLRSPRECSST